LHRPIPIAQPRKMQWKEDNIDEENWFLTGAAGGWVLSARTPVPRLPRKLVSTDIVDDIGTLL